MKGSTFRVYPERIFVVNLDNDNAMTPAFIPLLADVIRDQAGPRDVVQFTNKQVTGTTGRIGASGGFWSQMAGYDEQFLPMGYQDIDLMNRAKLVGGTIHYINKSESGATVLNHTDKTKDRGEAKVCNTAQFGAISWSSMNTQNIQLAKQKMKKKLWRRNVPENYQEECPRGPEEWLRLGLPFLKKIGIKMRQVEIRRPSPDHLLDGLLGRAAESARLAAGKDVRPEAPGPMPAPSQPQAPKIRTEPPTLPTKPPPAWLVKQPKTAAPAQKAPGPVQPKTPEKAPPQKAPVQPRAPEKAPPQPAQARQLPPHSAQPRQPPQQPALAMKAPPIPSPLPSNSDRAQHVERYSRNEPWRQSPRPPQQFPYPFNQSAAAAASSANRGKGAGVAGPAPTQAMVFSFGILELQRYPELRRCLAARQVGEQAAQKGRGKSQGPMVSEALIAECVRAMGIFPQFSTLVLLDCRGFADAMMTDRPGLGFRV